MILSRLLLPLLVSGLSAASFPASSSFQPLDVLRTEMQRPCRGKTKPYLTTSMALQHVVANRGWTGLWCGLVLGDADEIRLAAEEMGVGPYYPLLAAMLTARPWNDILQAAEQPAALVARSTKEDQAQIAGYVRLTCSNPSLAELKIDLP